MHMARATYRPRGAPTKLIQLRLAPDVHESISGAAQASDLSLSLYVETLVNALRAKDGQLPRVDHLVGTRGQLQLDLPR